MLASWFANDVIVEMILDLIAGRPPMGEGPKLILMPGPLPFEPLDASDRMQIKPCPLTFLANPLAKPLAAAPSCIEEAYWRAYEDGLSVLDAASARCATLRRSPVGAYAVFFDIDETLIDPNKPRVSVDWSDKLTYQAIDPVCELARAASARGFRVIILTARPECEDNRLLSTRSLSGAGVPFDELHFSGGDWPKVSFRALWPKSENGCPIILTIGDRHTDVLGSKEYGYSSILLPPSTALPGSASLRNYDFQARGPPDPAPA
jgi:hypothetical protein